MHHNPPANAAATPKATAAAVVVVMGLAVRPHVQLLSDNRRRVSTLPAAAVSKRTPPVLQQPIV